MRIVRSLLRIAIGTIIGLVALALVFGYGLKTYGERRLDRARKVFEARHGSLDTSSYFEPTPPVNRNGALLMAKAAQRVQLAGRASDLVADAAILPRDSWSPEMVSMVASQRRLYRDALALVHLGTAFPEHDFSAAVQKGPHDSGLSILGLLSCARLLSATARDQIYNGDQEGFATTLASLHGLARALGHELELNFQTAAWTAENFLLALTAELVKNPDTSHETLRLLQESQVEIDIGAGFRRFLAWYAASSITPPDDTQRAARGGRHAKLWSPYGQYNRVLSELVADLRAAIELEQFTAAVDRLLLPAARWTTPTQGRGALFAEFALVAGRVQVTATSRTVVHSALELRLTPSPERLRKLTLVTTRSFALSDETIAATLQEDGSFVVWARQADELAARLYFGRFNPPPPVRIAVCTTQHS